MGLWQGGAAGFILMLSIKHKRGLKCIGMEISQISFFLNNITASRAVWYGWNQYHIINLFSRINFCNGKLHLIKMFNYISSVILWSCGIFAIICCWWLEMQILYIYIYTHIIFGGMFELTASSRLAAKWVTPHPVVNVGPELRQREKMKRGFYFGKNREGI